MGNGVTRCNSNRVTVNRTQLKERAKLQGTNLYKCLQMGHCVTMQGYTDAWGEFAFNFLQNSTNI